MKDQNKSGGMFTDKDYIEALGLDPALEGKPAINEAIKKAVYTQTKQQYIESGLPESTATKLAMKDVR